MAIQNFSICALNIDENCIETLDTFTQNNVFHINVSLKPDYPECPYCHGPSKIKGYVNHSYNHLPVAGTPSVIDWKRRRYVCTDCGKTFTEVSPFGPENFR